MYPDSNIWVIGHSLGGALASLLGATFGAPVVAFESPGEKMASKRLHLPQLVRSIAVSMPEHRADITAKPSTQHITHVYNTADSIAMGACTGVLSLCYEGGYAMETRCHLGQSIVYDTVTNLGWSVGIKGHFIVPLIEEVLGKEWGPAVKEGREVPEARTEDDCVVSCKHFCQRVRGRSDNGGSQECYRWEFGSFPKRLEL